MPPETHLNGNLGYREYVCFPQDGRRHEIIDGEHIVNPAPDTYHQTLSRRIQFQLYAQIELRGSGQVFNAPTDLQLSETGHRAARSDPCAEPTHETLSLPEEEGNARSDRGDSLRSSVNNDRVLKKELYRRSAVPEYWIVDPDDHTVEQYVLRGDAYELSGSHRSRSHPSKCSTESASTCPKCGNVPCWVLVPLS